MPLNGPTRLSPGAYMLEVEAPDSVLDAIVRRPEAAAEVVRFVVGQWGAGVTYTGGGVAWSRSSGSLRRVWMIRLTVEDGAAPVVEAGLGSRLAPLVLVAVGLAVGAVSGFALSLYRLDPSEIPDAIEDVRDTVTATAAVLRALTFAGIVVGAWWVARAQGWIK